MGLLSKRLRQCHIGLLNRKANTTHTLTSQHVLIMTGARTLFRGLSRPLDTTPRPFTPDGGNHVMVDTPIVLSRIGTNATDYAASPQYDLHAKVRNTQDRKWSQEDQNKADADAKRKAMKELINTWQDRLQLISVITTFFAAIEAQLIGNVTPDDKTNVSRTVQAANTGLASALVVHIFAAMMSFIAAFFLVRFRLDEATHDEIKAELGESPKSSQYPDRPIFSTDPHLEQAGPFRRGSPPILLLENCHTICMLLSIVGFVLAMVGTMCYIWAQLPSSTSIFSTICVAMCCVASVGAIFVT